VWYILRTAVRWFAGICLFTIGISFAALGQVGTVPTKWTGTWKLNVKESTFGTILVPGVPTDFRILSQTARIEQAANGIRISGDSTFFADGESSTRHEDLPLRLDGTPTNLANASFSFRRIDNSAFEIISTLNVPNTDVDEVSRYVFSSDGSKLTATKIQTERALVPTSTDKSKGAVIRTSKFILVYEKLAEHE
jgi:hypothetical protein